MLFLIQNNETQNSMGFRQFFEFLNFLETYNFFKKITKIYLTHEKAHSSKNLKKRNLDLIKILKMVSDITFTEGLVVLQISITNTDKCFKDDT